MITYYFSLPHLLHRMDGTHIMKTIQYTLFFLLSNALPQDVFFAYCSNLSLQKHILSQPIFQWQSCICYLRAFLILDTQFIEVSLICFLPNFMLIIYSHFLAGNCCCYLIVENFCEERNKKGIEDFSVLSIISFFSLFIKGSTFYMVSHLLIIYL